MPERVQQIDAACNRRILSGEASTASGEGYDMPPPPWSQRR